MGLRVPKRGQMEMRLIRPVAIVRPDGAGAAGAAAEAHAIRAGRHGYMADAGRHIIAVAAECPDRAGRKAGLGGAAVAWAGAQVGMGQRDPLGERQRAAIGMPKAPVGMDQDAERRRMDRLRAPCPALERQVGRTAEREERSGPEHGRQLPDQAAGPAIQRMGRAVVRLGRCFESQPLQIAHQPDEHDRPRVGGRVIAVPRMKRAAAGKAGGLDGPDDRLQLHAVALRPGRGGVASVRRRS